MFGLLYANQINSHLSRVAKNRIQRSERSDINNNCAQLDAMEKYNPRSFIPEEGFTNADLEAKLIIANTKIQGLEVRLRNIEQNDKVTVEKLSQHGEEMKKQSKNLRDENKAQKQMYLAFLKEIEEKNQIQKKKYKEAVKENKSLRKKNQELIENEKSLREELFQLKLLLKNALEDRDRILKVLKVRSNGNSKGFGTAETEDFYWKTTEKAQALLNRQKETKLIIEPSLAFKSSGLDSLKLPATIESQIKLGGIEEDEILQELFFIS